MSVKTIPNLLSDTSSAINDNTTRDISPADVRNVISDLIDSSINRVTDKLLLNLREYVTSRAYEVGEAAVLSLTIYQCITPTSGTFTPAHWKEIGGIPSSSSSITAAGTNQATATILTKKMNRVDTVAIGTGVVEDAEATAGMFRTVQNNGLNDLKWYPFGTNQFYFTDGSGLQGAGIPITIASGNSAKYFCYDNGQLTIQG